MDKKRTSAVVGGQPVPDPVSDAGPAAVPPPVSSRPGTCSRFVRGHLGESGVGQRRHGQQRRGGVHLRHGGGQLQRGCHCIRIGVRSLGE